MLQTMLVTFRNYKEVALPGRELRFGNGIYKIEADATYRDGLCCAGRSVANILEEEGNVYALWMA